MDEQLKQITEKKVTQKEALLILAFALMEYNEQRKKSDEILNRHLDETKYYPLVTKLVFTTVGIILTAVAVAIVGLVIKR